jgi:hypothetical protein
MSPDAAYVIEQPHLVPLPDVPPPVYELLERSVDPHGYVSVDTNRYSVPSVMSASRSASPRRRPKSRFAARASRSPSTRA